MKTRELFIILFSLCLASFNTKSSEGLTLQVDWYKLGILIIDGVYNTEMTALDEIFKNTRYKGGIKAENVLPLLLLLKQQGL